MEYQKLIEGNRTWATEMRRNDPRFFEELAKGQQPSFLLIGCCDSRVPFEVITGVKPGDVFVHRNIANQVHPTDISMLSALEYAVNALNVPHIIVCGHTQCGGVKAAMGRAGSMLVDNWLQGIRDTLGRHDEEMQQLDSDDARFDRLVDLNVLEQVYQLSRTPVVQAAWKANRRLLLHGVAYDLHTGEFKELVHAIGNEDEANRLREAREDGVAA